MPRGSWPTALVKATINHDLCTEAVGLPSSVKPKCLLKGLDWFWIIDEIYGLILSAKCVDKRG